MSAAKDQEPADNNAAPGGFRIIRVRSQQDLVETIALFYEYVSWLDLDLKFQNFDQEMASMPGKYQPPTGELILARTAHGAPAGCVAVRKLDEDICEVKRLWVRDLAKGKGLGKTLVSVVVGIGRELGYRKMRLDTLPRMGAALALYRSIGFTDVEPYYATPFEDMHFLELDLSEGTSTVAVSSA